MEGTEWLRASAPHWTLAGDEQLLHTLQSLHQRIMCKCEETNSRLQEMVTALDDAALALHNVNNKFMALSNGQFVESRVYDDDDVTPIPAPAPEDPPRPPEDVDTLRESLMTLERLHERVTILRDSDSDDDSDEGSDCDRVVLSPLDLYADRPLPHIIGSKPFKEKWHAGLVCSSSESSSCSARGTDYSREVSDDDDDDAEPGGYAPRRVDDTPSSPSPTSSGGWGAPVTPSVPPVAATVPPMAPTAPSQAAVAAALARRLGADFVKPPPPEPDESPEPQKRVMYAPKAPLPGVVFPSEPPPLPSESSEDEDIFAELLAPRKPRIEDDSIFSDVVDAKAPTAHTQRQVPETIREYPEPVIDEPTVVPENVSKKPIGAISLFGTSKTSDSIGAAILKRNQRKSSSDDESDDKDTQTDKPSAVVRNAKPANAMSKQIATEAAEKVFNKAPQKKQHSKDEKDIFNDLFAKANKKPKESDKNEVKKQDSKPNKDAEKKVDLFSDNLFDDMDDIFATNIVSKAKVDGNKNEKSLFDDDDLFADIGVADNGGRKKDDSAKGRGKSIFDSDDDLFTEPVVKDKADGAKVATVSNTVTKNLFQGNVYDDETPNDESANKESNVKKGVTDIVSEAKGLFDDDDDDESELFSEKRKETKPPIENTKRISMVSSQVKSSSLFDDADDVIHEKPVRNVVAISIPSVSETKSEKGEAKSQSAKVISAGLFDDSDDDLFSKKVVNKEITLDRKLVNEPNAQSEKANMPSLDKKDKEIKKSKGLFLEDSDSGDNLFISVNVDKREIVTDVTSPKERPKVKIDESSNFEDEKSTFINKSKVFNSPDIFEDHDDANDLFKSTSNDDQITAEAKITKEISRNEMENVKNEKVKNKDVNYNNTIIENKILKDSEEVKSVKPEVNTRLVDEVAQKKDVLNNVIESDEIFKPSEDKSKLTDIGSSILVEETKPPNNNVFGDDMKQVIEKAEDNNSKTVYDIPAPVVTPNVINSRLDTQLSEDEIDVKTNKNNTKESSETTEDIFANIGIDAALEEDIPPPESKIDKPDIFSDIFNDQPPVFEKPKEPKKSKNVNALFDDDSDDEALFFKKNDVILEDKPEDLSIENNANLFGIFHDEPPAIDVDFIPKPVKTEVTRTESTKTNVIKTESDISSVKPDKIKESPPKSEVLNISNLLESDDDLFSPKPQDEFKNYSDVIPEQPTSYTDDLEAKTNLNESDLETNTYKAISESNIEKTVSKTSLEKSISEIDIDKPVPATKPVLKTNLEEISENNLERPESTKDIDKPASVTNLSSLEKPELKTDIEKAIPQSNLDTPVSEPNVKLSNESVPKPVSEINLDKPTSKANIDDTVKTDTDKPDGTNKKATPKKVGKLKPMNFSINVNTLLPGASPKKVQKPQEQTDGQALSTKSNEELNSGVKTSNVEVSKNILVKSVSFEGDPDSPVLDNKLSKERAKIQIKRRPSTRKARREAVRKSAVDLADDSTDNSSSIDDRPNDKETERSVPASDKAKDLGNLTSQLDVVDAMATIAKSIDNRHFISPDKNEKLKINESIKSENRVNVNRSDIKDVKSKIVYVLNDEDIFTDIKPTTSVINPKEISEQVKPKEETRPTKKVLNIVDDDDDEDIFKNIPIATKTVKRQDNEEFTDVKPTVNIVNPNKDKSEQLKPKEENRPSKKVLSIVDDDDDLFKNIHIGTKHVETESKTAVNKEDSKGLTDKLTNTLNPKDIIEQVKVKEETRPKKVLSILDDDEDIFKNVPIPTKSLETESRTLNVKEGKGITTLGSVYADDNPKKVVNKSLFNVDEEDDDIFKSAKDSNTKATVIPKDIPVDKSVTKTLQDDIPKGIPVTKTEVNTKAKKSLFDEARENDELFKGKKVVANNKSMLFGSDSEEDLFTGKSSKETPKTSKVEPKSKTEEPRKETKEVKREMKRVEVKNSLLFGDEIDDDDLFSAKPKPAQATHSRSERVASSPVFQDPLSLASDDD